MVSSDRELRSKVRSELGLTNASRVPDSVIDDEIETAKAHLSDEIKQRLETGETLDFNGDNLELALEHFVLLRLAAVDSNGRVPRDHPRSLSQVRRTTFENEQHNFWRDRMVRALNKV